MSSYFVSKLKAWWPWLVLLLIAASLRFSQLTELPRGLNWDETAYGYNAYSLLQTGRDEWGQPWPIFLKSFGEYKPALLSYLIMPMLWLFPHGNWAVRSVTAGLGCLGVLASFGIALKVSGKREIALFTALTMAVAPWHIHFSRVALDPGVAHPFLLLGFWAWISKRRWQWWLGAGLLALSMYAYNAERVFVPLLLVAHASLFWRREWKTVLRQRWSVGLFLVLMGGLIVSSTLWGAAGTRARMVSWLGSSQVNEQVAAGQLMAYKLHWPVVAWLHRPELVTIGLVARQYSYYWRPDFLFFSEGGVNASPLLGFPERGNLPEILIVPLLIGIVVAGSSRHQGHWFMLLWALLAVVPGALTTDGPHAGRALIMLPALNYLIAIGIAKSADFLAPKIKPNFTYVVIWLVIAASTYTFLLDYTTSFPEKSEWDWQGQFQSMAEWVAGQQPKYNQVAISQANDYHALLFYAWYSRANPRAVQAGQHSGTGVFYLSGYDSTRLLPHSEQSVGCALLEPKTLVVLSPSEASLLSTSPLQSFYHYNRYVSPEIAFQVYDTDQLLPLDREQADQNCTKWGESWPHN